MSDDYYPDSTPLTDTVAGIAYALGQDVYLWEDGEWQESDGNFE